MGRTKSSSYKKPTQADYCRLNVAVQAETESTLDSPLYRGESRVEIGSLNPVELSEDGEDWPLIAKESSALNVLRFDDAGGGVRCEGATGARVMGCGRQVLRSRDGREGREMRKRLIVK